MGICDCPVGGHVPTQPLDGAHAQRERFSREWDGSTVRHFTVWLLLGKLIKVQPNPRKKTLLTTSFRSLGEVSCLPSAQPHLEAPERQGDRAPLILPCAGRPTQPPSSKVYSRRASCRLPTPLRPWTGQSPKGRAPHPLPGVEVPDTGPQVTPDNVLICLRVPSRPLLVLASVGGVGGEKRLWSLPSADSPLGQQVEKQL